MGKNRNPYTVNLDDETAQRLEYIANARDRKPRELLRLLLAPVILAEFVKQQQEEHPENKQAPEVAKLK